MAASLIRTKAQLRQAVDRALAAASATDLHTHLYPKAFGELLHWGMDALLTSEELVSETLRLRPELSREQFAELSRREQADRVWETLFIERIPYSEACRSILSALRRLNLDISARDLHSYRTYFDSVNLEDYIDLIFKLAGVTTVCMSNNPFCAAERQAWEAIDQLDPRFNTAIRLDTLLNEWGSAWVQLNEWGYEVEASLNEKTCKEVQGFLKYWIARTNPLYMAVTVPPSFAYPELSLRGRLIKQCILPVAREANIPLAFLLGTQLDGDLPLSRTGYGTPWAFNTAIEALCSEHPDHKFMCAISTGNSFELAKAARRYNNLYLIGGGELLHLPGQFEETIRVWFEFIGTRRTAPYSDSHVLEQLLHSWQHTRVMMAHVLNDSYSKLMDIGWGLTEEEIAHAAADLLGGSLWTFLGRPNPATAYKS